MKTVYLITDRYENGEFYNIYGVYTNEVDARKAWPDQLGIFLDQGPDDCHYFRLTKHKLTNAQAKELDDHISKFNTVEDYAYDETFVEYMDNLMSDNRTEELEYSDGLEGYEDD